MGLFHDVETLIEAARRVQDHPEILFLFIGGGGKQDALVESVKKWRLGNVQVLPYQPREDLPYTLTCGDLSAVTLARGMEGLSVPAKLYTALAAGQAILAVMGEGSDVAEIIRECRCGVRIDQGDAEGLVKALLRCLQEPLLLAEMKANARRCLEEHFTLGHAVQQYHEIFSRIGTSRRLSLKTEAWAEERRREHGTARDEA
jgi:glycosyltransferase involved in cell wall biosynthesis